MLRVVEANRCYTEKSKGAESGAVNTAILPECYRALERINEGNRLTEYYEMKPTEFYCFMGLCDLPRS